MLSRRTALKSLAASAAAFGWQPPLTAVAAEVPQVFTGDRKPDDDRLGPLKDLDGYFPFVPSRNKAQWEERAEYVRRQMRLACGLWPELPKTPLKPVIHGRVDRGEYIVEKVYFQGLPGLYVTGNLYRPKKIDGKIPGILCPHGHWRDGRFHDHGAERVKKEIEIGAEKYEVGGRHPIQARLVTLARMGCIVFHYDMLGYVDSAPITYELAHRFAKQRPKLSGPDRWGLYSAQAALRLINVMGLQTHNSVRALDWLLTLDHVDSDRIGVTGSSGGGTQTFMLTAIDDRVDAAFPAVMVSTAMQGGCTCENAPYLRIDTGNIEFAALAAPRPLGLTAANDWTRELETKGLPELKRHYRMLGVGENVEGRYFDFRHNYNFPARAMMYEFFNRHFKLGHKSPIVERDYEPLSKEEMTVWNEQHPRPESGVEAELELMQTIDRIQQRQLERLTPTDEESLAQYRRVVGGALEVMIGRPLPTDGDVEFETLEKEQLGDYKRYVGLLKQKVHGEELPIIFLHPNDWNGKVVVWATDQGKAGIYNDKGQPVAAIRKLLKEGSALAAADLLYQGELVGEGGPLRQTRVVKNPRQFLGYTVGYNHPLFAQRVHDLLSIVAFCKYHPDQPMEIHLVGRGMAGPWAAAASAIAGQVVDRTVVGHADFRFAGITDIRDLNLLPGAVKCGDLPGMLALIAPRPLRLEGVKEVPALTAAAYKAAGASGKVKAS